jgi:hypothetical protein
MSDPNTPDSLWLRLLWLVIIAAMMSVAQTLVSLLTLVQLIIMATNKRQPNAEIAAFGKRLGLWLAHAARFQTAATDDKPWPWAPLG